MASIKKLFKKFNNKKGQVRQTDSKQVYRNVESTVQASKERLSVVDSKSNELLPFSSKDGIRTSQFSAIVSQQSIQNLHLDKTKAKMHPAISIVSRLLLTSQNSTPSNKGLMIRNSIAPRFATLEDQSPIHNRPSSKLARYRRSKNTSIDISSINLVGSRRISVDKMARSLSKNSITKLIKGAIKPIDQQLEARLLPYMSADPKQKAGQFIRILEYNTPVQSNASLKPGRFKHLNLGSPRVLSSLLGSQELVVSANKMTKGSVGLTAEGARHSKQLRNLFGSIVENLHTESKRETDIASSQLFIKPKSKAGISNTRQQQTQQPLDGAEQLFISSTIGSNQSLSASIKTNKLLSNGLLTIVCE